MPLITRCCFSKNLRNGTIACAVWSLIHCVFSLGLSISDIVALSATPSSYDYPRSKENNTETLLVLFWASLIVSFFTSLASILLLIAVIKSHAKLMVPWLVMVAMQILFDAAGIVFQIMINGFSKILIGILLVWIIFTLINIYCALCVLSHYQEVKMGRGRPSDYLGANRNVRYVAEVQHVHIGDPSVNYVASQHTVYSFHSQNLFDNEGKETPKPMNGGPTALSQCNGRVLELRPVASLPANMDTRFGLGGSNYTGSIEMKVVDSIPVTVDKRNLIPYNGNLDVGPVGGKRPRRFRTVSESAVRQPMIKDVVDTVYTNSLQDIAERNKESAAPAADNSSNGDSDSSSGGAKSKASTYSVGGEETTPLTDPEHEHNS